MERVASGAAKNLAGAVRQLDNERDEAKDGAALAANLSKPLDEAVTLHRAAPLEELERLRAEFLGMVSHDLRVPLTSIKGSAATVLGAPSSWTAPKSSSSSGSSTRRLSRAERR